jgi:hypothetical protein
VNKLTIFCLLGLTQAHSSFGMLLRQATTHAKKVRPICVDIAWCEKGSQEQRQLMLNRNKIKKMNDIWIPLLIEQNKVIDKINELNRPMTEFESFFAEQEITSLAQKLMDLEQQILHEKKPE